ncbi:MAG: ferric reductase-like transmembrane domain-containing protein [Microbacteriaceae bacterium]|nr:ferric reductase-like transmembrane domain-containing protein [Microbacteriaceae bacterium]
MGAAVWVRGRDHRAAYRRRVRLSVLLVTLLWASGGVASTLLLASDEIVTSVGIAAGVVGTDFILLMLVLAARIPLLDRTMGHDRAIAVHRSLSEPTLYLLLAHVALLLTWCAITQKIDLVTETVRLWNTANFPLAITGLGLLLVMVVSSLVAVPQQLSTDGILTQGSLPRGYWICRYALGAAGGQFFVWRFWSRRT